MNATVWRAFAFRRECPVRHRSHLHRTLHFRVALEHTGIKDLHIVATRRRLRPKFHLVALHCTVYVRLAERAGIVARDRVARLLQYEGGVPLPASVSTAAFQVPMS